MRDFINRKKQVKKNKTFTTAGITLIALVITVVIIIILAGIAINLVIGDNGILTRAREAALDQRGASLEEQIALWKADQKIDDLVDSNETMKLNEFLTSLEDKNLLTSDEVATIKNVGYIAIGKYMIDFRSDEASVPAGLYETGSTTSIIKTWAQLKTDGDITVEDVDGGKKLTYISNTLAGDLYISDEITVVSNMSSQCDFDTKYLTGLYIPYTVTSLGVFCNFTNLKNVIIDAQITDIQDEAFMCCYSLSNITIPDSVTSIGGRAFEGCTSLSNIAIPDNVTNIEVCAFYSCTSLSNITIPMTVTTMGSYVFEYWTSSQTINLKFDSASAIPSMWDSNWNTGCNATIKYTPNVVIDGVTYNSDCTTLISYSSSKTDTEFTIPNSVTSIGEDAFSNCTSLINIIVPNSVTNGLEWIYSPVLENIEVNEGNLHYASINGVLYSKDKTTLIMYPVGKQENSFAIPNSVTRIGSCAFCGCTSLNNITIPNSVTSIEQGAFAGCISLSNITIPDSVTSIEDGAFYDCTSLSNLVIPNSVTSIGNDSFGNCTSLSNIIIPSTVATMGGYAFENWTSSQTINLQFASASVIPSTWDSNWNTSCNATINYNP